MMKKHFVVIATVLFSVLSLEKCLYTTYENNSRQENSGREQSQSASDYGIVESAQDDTQTTYHISETDTGLFPSDNAYVTPRPSSRTDYSSKVSDPSTCATTITPFSDDVHLTITPVPSPQGSEFSTAFPSQDDTDQNNPFTHEGELYFFPDD